MEQSQQAPPALDGSTPTGATSAAAAMSSDQGSPPPPFRPALATLLMIRRHLPLWLLGVLSLLSLGARLWRIEEPFDKTTGNGALIFDEKYYVNAARVLLNLHVACHNDGTGCDPYDGRAGGTDPNSEHPPLAKLLIASGIRLLGDRPLGWRLLPIVFGSLAILTMYWLARSAGGGRWLALGAASLMAVDNLSLVHGRIATLDVFVVVFMMAAVALYLRGHPLLAGVALGVGSCMKLTAPFVVLVLLLVEVLRVASDREWRGPTGWRAPAIRALPLLTCAAAGVVVYLGLLDALDHWVTPFHNPTDPCPGSGNSYANSFVHSRFMLCFAAKLTSPNGPTGIASYPWQWLLDLEPINYYTVNVSSGTGVDKVTHPVVAFQGLINPAILFLTLPALALAVGAILRRRDDLSIVAIAWCLGTYLPLVYGSVVDRRTEYLYYMVVILPGIYLAVARLLSRRTVPVSVVIGFVCILGYMFWWLFPFRTF